MSEQAEGYSWRSHQALEREAWLASVLLHAWCENPPSPQDLLSPVATDAEAAMDALVAPKNPLAALEAAYARQAALRRN